MDSLTTTRGWLTRPRIVGTPLRWASQTGTLGLLLGALVPSATLGVPLGISLAAGNAYNPMFLLGIAACNAASGLVGGLLGGIAGLVMPGILDRVRGRLPLPLLVAGATAIGAGIGAAASVAWLGPLIVTVGSLEIATFAPYLAAGGAAFGAVAAAIWALPFVVGTVLGRAWPVTRAVGFGIPALTALAVLLLILI